MKGFGTDDDLGRQRTLITEALGVEGELIVRDIKVLPRFAMVLQGVCVSTAVPRARYKQEAEKSYAGGSPNHGNENPFRAV